MSTTEQNIKQNEDIQKRQDEKNKYRKNVRSRSRSKDKKYDNKKDYKRNYQQQLDRSYHNKNRDERSKSRSRDRDRKYQKYNDSHHKKDDRRRRSTSRERYNNGKYSGHKGGEKNYKNDKQKRKEQEYYEDKKKYEYGKKGQSQEKSEESVEKELPCFEPSGILALYNNSVKGVALKFTEPLDAQVPIQKWRIYPFKGEEALDVIHLKGQSSFLFGKDSSICDIPLRNPTISSQHCVIQFREITTQDEETALLRSRISPYLMDLQSTNGTFLNGDKIEPARYYQLLDKDVIKMGKSDREYVIMLPRIVKKKKQNEDEEEEEQEEEEQEENNQN